MAPIGGPTGGGQAGFGSGGSFTGAAEALEIAGDFAYAFSGLQTINTSAVTVFDFTTGNYLFEGEIFMTSGVTLTDVEDGSFNIFTLSLNGVDMMYYKIQSSGEAMPATITMPIIIPAYTEVGLTVLSNGTGSSYKTAASMSGRIFKD
jgi:hypothetical protein